MAILLQISYSQKGKKVILYGGYIHFFSKKRNPKSDISYWTCRYYRGKTCNAVLYAQEINGDYFLVKKPTHLLHLPDPEEINNYRLRR